MILAGDISTNLAAAVLASGNVVLGVGRADGVIRLWPAE